MGFKTFLLVRSMHDKQQHVILFVLIYVVFLNGLQIYTYARSFIMFGKGKAINVGGLGSFIDFKTILLIRALYSKQKHVIIFCCAVCSFPKRLAIIYVCQKFYIVSVNGSPLRMESCVLILISKLFY